MVACTFDAAVRHHKLACVSCPSKLSSHLAVVLPRHALFAAQSPRVHRNATEGNQGDNASSGQPSLSDQAPEPVDASSADTPTRREFSAENTLATTVLAALLGALAVLAVFVVLPESSLLIPSTLLAPPPPPEPPLQTALKDLLTVGKDSDQGTATRDRTDEEKRKEAERRERERREREERERKERERRRREQLRNQALLGGTAVGISALTVTKWAALTAAAESVYRNLGGPALASQVLRSPGLFFSARLYCIEWDVANEPKGPAGGITIVKERALTLNSLKVNIARANGLAGPQEMIVRRLSSVSGGLTPKSHLYETRLSTSPKRSIVRCLLFCCLCGPDAVRYWVQDILGCSPSSVSVVADRLWILCTHTHDTGPTAAARYGVVRLGGSLCNEIVWSRHCGQGPDQVPPSLLALAQRLDRQQDSDAQLATSQHTDGQTDQGAQDKAHVPVGSSNGRTDAGQELGDLHRRGSPGSKLGVVAQAESDIAHLTAGLLTYLDTLVLEAGPAKPSGSLPAPSQVRSTNTVAATAAPEGNLAVTGGGSNDTCASDNESSSFASGKNSLRSADGLALGLLEPAGVGVVAATAAQAISTSIGVAAGAVESVKGPLAPGQPQTASCTTSVLASCETAGAATAEAATLADASGCTVSEVAAAEQQVAGPGVFRGMDGDGSVFRGVVGDESVFRGAVGDGGAGKEVQCRETAAAPALTRDELDRLTVLTVQGHQPLLLLYRQCLVGQNDGQRFIRTSRLLLAAKQLEQ